MTRCYADANYLYASLRSSTGDAGRAVAGWRAAVADELRDDSAVVSALVLDELAYRLVLAWLRDDGDEDPLTTYRAAPRATSRKMRRRFGRTWEALDSLELELAVTDGQVVARAKNLIVAPGLAPRDAFHAAHAIVAGCEVIVSADRDFDALPELQRLGPPV